MGDWKRLLGYHSEWDHKNGSYLPIIPPDIHKKKLTRLGLDILVIKHLHKLIPTDPRTLRSWRRDSGPPFNLGILSLSHLGTRVLSEYKMGSKLEVVRK